MKNKDIDLVRKLIEQTYGEEGKDYPIHKFVLDLIASRDKYKELYLTSLVKIGDKHDDIY